MQAPRRPFSKRFHKGGSGNGAGGAKPTAAPRPAPGLAARELATGAIGAVLDLGRTLEEAFEAGAARAGPLEARDRALARLIVMTALRRKGELERVIGSFLEKPLPADSGRLTSILLSGAAQLLLLDTPPHAAIGLAVDQCRLDRKARRFDKLTNAVLRRVSEKGRDILAGLDGVLLDIPPWLLTRWQEAYGEARTREIAEASLKEAALDLSVKGDPVCLAERLGGVALATGSVRLARAGRVEDLDGFAEGDWWVQDAAAALPAKLLGHVAGQTVADLCAAPGGKTAQLALAGAHVTAVDVSAKRLERLSENLARLKLSAETVAADIATWQPGHAFDAVLLDAPCSATGTIRRHPDILHLKRKDDTADRVALQRRLLDRSAALTRAGGLLVYCVCSLEPDEGPAQIARFLASHPDWTREPVRAGEAGIDATWLTPEGDLRTLPCHLPAAEPGLSGLDGFYAARLKKAAAPKFASLSSS
jgi:16S rRNA (cytosine967-C5)-methyltransferase